jgi:nucleoside-diphosphate-sugar epimerase
MRQPPELTVVTGAAGWLGTALMHALVERPGTVRALVREPADVEALAGLGPRVEVHVGDVTDAGALRRLLAGAEGADLLHCAGVIHPPRTSEFERVNEGGTRAAVEAAAAAGVRRLVHVSSNSPFGFNPTPEDTFRADEPFNPYMGYGRSKMRAELIVRDAPAALETVIVRPPWFYGPHQPLRQTTFFTLVRKGRFPLVGDGRNRRSMGYVENLVDGLLLAELVPEAAGRAYWLADRRPYEMREIVAAVRDACADAGLEVQPQRVRLPAAAGTLAEWLDGRLQATGRYVQEVHVLSEMPRTIACDISRAEQELGYAPRVELGEGMRRSVRWCLDQGIEL